MQKVFEFEVEGGKKVGFRFNMLTNGEACRLEGGISLTELFDRLGITGKREVDLVTLLNFFYAAAVNYAKGKKLPIDFEVSDVSDWLDYRGLDESMKMMTEGLKTPELKNEPAPESQPGL